MKHLSLWVGAAIALFVAGGTLWAADYYVDPNGNDAADGTTSETAWQSIERVNDAPLVAGDRVLFRAGGVWRGNLVCKNGEAGSPIDYGAFGEGEKPTILGSVDLTDPSCWVAPADPNGRIWKTSPDRITHSEPYFDFAQKTWRLWTEGEASGSIETVGQTTHLRCEKSGTAGSHFQMILGGLTFRKNECYALKFRIKSDKPFSLGQVTLNRSGSPWTQYARSVPESVEVSSEEQEVEFRFISSGDEANGRLSLFLGGLLPDETVLEMTPVDAQILTIDSLGLSTDVGNIILTPKGKLPADPTMRFADDTYRRAAFKRWKPEDLTAQDDFWYNKETREVWYWSEKNPVELFDEIEAARLGHIVRMSKYVTLENIAGGFGASHGVAGIQSKGCTIRGCDFFWIGGGDHSAGYKNPTRFGNGVEFWSTGEDHLVENCRFRQIYDVAMSIQGPEKTVYRNIVWRGNTVSKCEQSFELWLTHPESEIVNNVFEHNRCYDAGFGWSHEQRPNKNGTHLLGYDLQSKTIDFKIHGNIFCGGRNALIMFWNSRIAEFDLDDNIWWQPASDGVNGIDAPLFIWGLWNKETQKKLSFEQYREATGNDAHSRFEPSIEP